MGFPMVRTQLCIDAEGVSGMDFLWREYFQCILGWAISFYKHTLLSIFGSKLGNMYPSRQIISPQ